MNLIKRLFCKHNQLKTITNLYGDAINIFNGARSIKECQNCGKIKYGSLDKNCSRVNEF